MAIFSQFSYNWIDKFKYFGKCKIVNFIQITCVCTIYIIASTPIITKRSSTFYHFYSQSMYILFLIMSSTLTSIYWLSDNLSHAKADNEMKNMNSSPIIFNMNSHEHVQESYCKLVDFYFFKERKFIKMNDKKRVSILAKCDSSYNGNSIPRYIWFNLTPIRLFYLLMTQ